MSSCSVYESWKNWVAISYRVWYLCNAVNFLTIPTKGTHSSPVSSPFRARYGVYFVLSNADLYSASTIAVMSAISCYIGLCYNGTRLYNIQGIVTIDPCGIKVIPTNLKMCSQVTLKLRIISNASKFMIVRISRQVRAMVVWDANFSNGGLWYSHAFSLFVLNSF